VTSSISRPRSPTPTGVGVCGAEGAGDERLALRKHYPEWRDRYYELVDTQEFKGIDVSRYERRNG
jgi:hypothetical protein